MKLYRFLNFIIDLFILSVLITLLNYGISRVIGIQDYRISAFLFYSSSFFTFIFYYVYFELKFQKTIGKFITQTKVVTHQGNKPENADIFARTFFRLLPFDHLSYIFTNTGFHDYLSKTKVIRDR